MSDKRSGPGAVSGREPQEHPSFGRHLLAPELAKIDLAFAQLFNPFAERNQQIERWQRRIDPIECSARRVERLGKGINRWV